jgi:hypothetical protein
MLAELAAARRHSQLAGKPGGNGSKLTPAQENQNTGAEAAPLFVLVRKALFDQPRSPRGLGGARLGPEPGRPERFGPFSDKLAIEPCTAVN